LKKKLKVFCDFDGTVTLDDIGDAFFTKFSNGKVQEEIVKWETGEIDSRELFLREIKMIDVTPGEFDVFLRKQQMDSHFKEFVKFCDQNKIPISILSDGMDIYINPLLAWNHLDHLPVYSNKLKWNGSNKLEAEFPYFKDTCGHCANCKGAYLRKIKNKTDHIVFIGDGFSDICAVPEADTIFAKSSLANYCSKNKIQFKPFNNFSDILPWFESNIKFFN
jgi:2-hydroxy-3-keto-5-methylthiopentenyl-1-phosphate phosphatase